MDRIGNALPIVPFAFGNERVERFENLLFTELGNMFEPNLIDL
jgi:hypothetical protein